MAYASRLYPRAKPRGFTLQWIKNSHISISPLLDQVFIEKFFKKNLYKIIFD